MPAREMEQYLNEKLGCFLKILAIVQEQQNFIQDKNLDRFKVYIEETSKLIEKIRELDNRHKDALEEWNSGKVEISKKASGMVDGLVARIRETIEKISEIQPVQIKHFMEEKRLLEEEVVKIRQDRKLFAGYKDTKKSTGLLDIKK